MLHPRPGFTARVSASLFLAAVAFGAVLPGASAQEVIRFSSHPTLTARGLEPRHVDLRVFALAGRDAVLVPDVALSRVALESEGLLVNSSQGGGSKDTWIGLV